MLDEIFPESFENFETMGICMENNAGGTGWQKLFFSYKCFQLSAAIEIATLRYRQCTKKVVSDSPVLVDFAIGLVNSVFNLPNGQVRFFEEFE